jgi:hypothetical protein
MMSVIVFILWAIVATGTVRGSFFSPGRNTDMKLQELKIKRIIARTTGAKAG